MVDTKTFPLIHDTFTGETNDQIVRDLLTFKDSPKRASRIHSFKNSLCLLPARLSGKI